MSFNHERLRMFAEGVPDRTTGVRRFPIPEDELLLGLDLYLTDEDSEYSHLSREELHGGNWAGMASRLSRFLAHGVDETPRISHLNLSGRFRSAAESSVGSSPLLLTIEEFPDDKRVLAANLVVDVTVAVAAGMPVEKYDGWIVISPEDNLVMLLKNRRTRQNYFCLALGIDSSVYDGASAATLVFLRHSLPLDVDANEPIGSDFLDRWLRQNGSNLLIFQRQS